MQGASYQEKASAEIRGESCMGFWGWIFCSHFPWKNDGGKNPPKNPQQNSNQNLGVWQPKSTQFWRPKSTLWGSALDGLVFEGEGRIVSKMSLALWQPQSVALVHVWGCPRRREIFETLLPSSQFEDYRFRVDVMPACYRVDFGPKGALKEGEKKRIYRFSWIQKGLLQNPPRHDPGANFQQNDSDSGRERQSCRPKVRVTDQKVRVTAGQTPRIRTEIAQKRPPDGV